MTVFPSTTLYHKSLAKAPFHNPIGAFRRKADYKYEIAVKFNIKNSAYVEHQYLGLTNSFPVQDLTLRVEAPANLQLSECRYNIFSHSVDRVPSKTQSITPANNAIEKSFKKLVVGERYNIEWTIK